MFFTQWHFLVIYLPLYILIYYLTPPKKREYVLLLGGLIMGFFAQWLMLTLVINLLFAFAIKKSRYYTRRIFFLIAVFVNVSFVLVCKFFFGKIPTGVGFALFQYISYLYYLYRYESEELNPIKYFNYFLFFPKTIQGPIVSYKKFYDSFEYKPDIEMLESGISHLAMGLFFKVWIADRFGILWNDVLMVGVDSISPAFAWVAMGAFCAMLYFDFQGYSLMAIGMGQMLGVNLPKNFNHPYLSRTVSEFYRRWHMTLGQWFKECIYIPMGGSKAGSKKLFFNLLLVWFLTGLWHGSGLNYLIWAGCILVLIILEKFVWGDFLNRHAIISRLYLWLVIPFSWMIFAFTDLRSIATYFTRLFPFADINSITQYRDVLTYGKNQIITILLAFFVSLPLWDKVFDKYRKSVWVKVITALILAFSLYGLFKSDSSPFMYSTF